MIRPFVRCFAMLGATTALTGGLAMPAIAEDFALTLEPLGTFTTGAFDKGAAEIVAFSPESKNLYVVNGHFDAIDIIGVFSPSSPRLVKRLPIADWGQRINSVAVNGPYVAAAIEAGEVGKRGLIALFDLEGRFVRSFPAGYAPDMIVFTPDGKFVLTADEGEPTDSYAVDPPGSVTIAATDGSSVRSVSFDTAPVSVLHLAAPEGTSPIADIEPEYIAISPDGRTAFVTLQESNAVAAVDIEQGTLKSVFSLGLKDWSLLKFDASDADGKVELKSWPIFSLMQPDAIAAYSAGGTTYLVTANEGDGREYKSYADVERLSRLKLDPAAFPNAAGLQADDKLGRLQVSSVAGDTDKDGDIDRIVAFGGRSLSIWTVDGRRVYDSGDAIETLIAQTAPKEFNSDGTFAGFDQHSDDRGPEPEGLAIGVVEGRTIAFLGLERASWIVAFDITDPSGARVVGYGHNNKPEGDPKLGTAGDLGPEGLTFIDAASSPANVPTLAVANEVSGSTTLYRITATGRPPIVAQAAAPSASNTTAPPPKDPPSQALALPSETPPTAPQPQPVAGVGRYQLQIAAAASRTDAAALAATVLKRHAGILEQAPSEIVEAPTGGKILFRVRIGAYDDRPSALEACERLKGAGQDCFVVAR